MIGLLYSEDERFTFHFSMFLRVQERPGTRSRLRHNKQGSALAYSVVLSILWNRLGPPGDGTENQIRISVEVLFRPFVFALPTRH